MTLLLKHGDTRELLKRLPDNCIDCVFTDPPYKIEQGGCGTTSGFGWKKGSNKTDDEHDDIQKGKLFKHNDIEFKEWLPDVYRVMKDSAHAYVMTNNKNLLALGNIMEACGFTINNILVMKKNNKVVNKWYMKDCEFVIFARKGSVKYLNNPSMSACLDVKMPRGAEKTHITQKPKDYIKLLVGNSTQENDVVLDPFFGSCSTGVSCKELNRNFIGFELDTEMFNLANDLLA